MAGDCVSLIGDFFDCLYCHGIIFPFFMSSSLESSLCKSLTNALRKLIYRKITVEYLNRVCRVVTFLNVQNWCVVVDCQGIILCTLPRFGLRSHIKSFLLKVIPVVIMFILVVVIVNILCFLGASQFVDESHEN